jgi:hypothetical protein
VKRACRLGAFVLVARLFAESVAAASGCEVVERSLEAVASEEPLERMRRPNAVLCLSGERERNQLGLDEATPEGRRRGASADASWSTVAVASATDGQASEAPMRRASSRAETSVSGSSL